MSLLYTAGLALAAVLGWAAVAKAVRPVETARGFHALGLPAPHVLVGAVPAAELAVAVLLVAVPWVGGMAALALLAGFTVILAGRLRHGWAAPCGCFGATAREPISFVELVRNGLLAVLAAAAVAVDRPVAPELADVIAVTTALATGALVLALAATKRDVGTIWSNTLAGEQ